MLNDVYIRDTSSRNQRIMLIFCIHLDIYGAYDFRWVCHMGVSHGDFRWVFHMPSLSKTWVKSLQESVNPLIDLSCFENG